MRGFRAVLLAVVVLVPRLTLVAPSPATVPAFLWSPQHYGSSQFEAKELVDYRTISPKDLARSVLSEGGWSNLVCSGDNLHQHVDIALVFVGRKLQSLDISKTKHKDPILIDLLKLSFAKSNISMAFPYVAVSYEKDALENSLVSGFVENCGHGLVVDHIAYLESCSIDGQDRKKLKDLHSFQNFVSSRMETGVSGKTDLIVFCNNDSDVLDFGPSEGKLLSELVNFLEKSGATYSVLYASDPHRGLQYPSHLVLSRLLAENTNGNSATNSSTRCDGVCQIKSSLLEGIFVGLVLLIILISGLCCMMGIDTPARFEAPPES